MLAERQNVSSWPIPAVAGIYTARQLSGDKLPAAELPGCRLVLQCATRGDLSDYTFTHVTYARVAGAACGVAGSEVPTRGLSFCTGFSGALADALPQSSTIAGTSTNWQ